MSRITLAAVLIVCLAVSACGRKGALEPPPPRDASIVTQDTTVD